MDVIYSYPSSCSDEEEGEEDASTPATKNPQPQQQHHQPQPPSAAGTDLEEGVRDDAYAAAAAARGAAAANDIFLVGRPMDVVRKRPRSLILSRKSSVDNNNSNHSPNKSSSLSVFTRRRPHIRGDWAGHIYISIWEEGLGSGTNPKVQVAGGGGGRGERVFRDRILFPSLRQWSAILPPEAIMVVPKQQQGEQKRCRGSSSSRNISGSSSISSSNDSGPCWHVSLSHPFYLPSASTGSIIESLRQRLRHFPAFSIQLTLPDYDDDLDDEDDVHDRHEDKQDGSNDDKVGDKQGQQHHAPSSNQVSQDNNNQSYPMWRVLVNDEKTRSFLAWPVWDSSTSGTAHLQALLNQVNHVLKDYQQPTYYDDESSQGRKPFFHVSLASTPGNHAATTTRTRTTQPHPEGTGHGIQDGTCSAAGHGEVSFTTSKTTSTSTIRSVLSIPVRQVECALGGSAAQHYSIPLQRSVGGDW